MKIKQRIIEFRHRLKEYLGQGISPAEISFAVALGIFIAFIPMIGVHTVIALALAGVLRLNPAIVFLGTQISNPMTFPFQIIVSAQTGHLLMYGNLLTLDWSAPGFDWKQSILWPTLVGSLVLGTVFSVSSYMGVYRYLKRRGW